MFTVSYNLGCRTCSTTDGIRTSYLIKDGKPADFLRHTEFRVMKQVEEWRRVDNKLCPFCSSPFVEVSNIEAENQPIYDFAKLSARCQSSEGEMYMLNMDKGSKGIELNEGGSNYPDPDFLKIAFTTLSNYLQSLDQRQFVSHSAGNFFVCFTANYDSTLERLKVHIERFRCHGFSAKEMYDGIRYAMKENDVQV